MAYTVTRDKTVFGNKGTVQMVITADAATQTIETGLQRVDHVQVTKISCNSANFKCAINSNASGVQSYGVFAVTGLTSGDHLHVTVYGPGL